MGHDAGRDRALPLLSGPPSPCTRRGGAGEFTDQTAARDTDTGDPDTIDVLVPVDATQGEVLDWARCSTGQNARLARGNTVVLPSVPLG